MAITDLPNFNANCLDPLPTKKDFKVNFETGYFVDLDSSEPCDIKDTKILKQATLLWANTLIDLDAVTPDETKSIEVLMAIPVKVSYNRNLRCSTSDLKDQGTCKGQTLSCQAYNQFVEDAICSSLSAVVPDVQNPNRKCGCIKDGQETGEHCHQCECPDCDRSLPIPEQLDDPNCGRTSLIESPAEIARNVATAGSALNIINNHIDTTLLQKKYCPPGRDKQDLFFRPQTITLTITAELELVCVENGAIKLIDSEEVRVSRRFKVFEEEKEEFDCLLDVKKVVHLNVAREDDIAECLYREGNICRFGQKKGAIVEKSVDNFRWCCPTVYFSRCYGWEYYMPRKMNEGFEVWWDQRKIITLQQLFGNTNSDITILDLNCLAEANVVDERKGDRTHYRLYCGDHPCTDGEIKEYIANNVPTLFRKFKGKLATYHDQLEQTVNALVASFNNKYESKKRILEKKKKEGCPCLIRVVLGTKPELIVSAPFLDSEETN